MAESAIPRNPQSKIKKAESKMKQRAQKIAVNFLSLFDWKVCKSPLFFAMGKVATAKALKILESTGSAVTGSAFIRGTKKFTNLFEHKGTYF